MASCFKKNISREFGGLPLVEAKSDLCIVLSDEDIKKGKKKDPAQCAIAHFGRRVYHAKKVAFFRSTAYIDLPDENGVRRVVRFMLSKPAKDFIKAFDKNEAVKSGVGLVLKAPSQSETLDAKLERRKKHMNYKHPRKPMTTIKKKIKKKPVAIDVRNGSGVFQTIK